MPSASIIIPAYNRSGFLLQAIRSAFAQTCSDYEVIVVDDGSAEDLEQLVSHLAEDGGGQGRLRYVQQPHLGANAARNRGLRESQGEFVQFLDSDDLLHPAKLEIAREFLVESPKLDMVFGLDEYFRDSPGDMRILWNRPDPPHHLDRFLWDDAVWHTGSPLWRRGALERIGPWNETLVCWQDWEFHIRALCRGIKYTSIPSVLAHLRDHSQSRSTNLEPLVVREQSKLQAALLAANELEKASLWNGERGDALAVFLLSITAWFTRASQWESAVFALKRAEAFAESANLRLAIKLMRGSLGPAHIVDIGNGNPTAITYRFSDLTRLIPHRTRYRRSPIVDRVGDKPSRVDQSSASKSKRVEQKALGIGHAAEESRVGGSRDLEDFDSQASDAGQQV